ncbi:hypothetical protein SEVIR_1G070900v4 [Setaria viridis]|uniref:DUF1618 domain-containing protein n=1 Tax=Setaria viridis TaxID=4556 RepID=A0A4U6W6F9_SETVI|nr:uncharacterized protein LOC117865297 isoform X2 [Setaria viridis]TKW37782.1 hypothetical protein SEVIR_1G070900v2 [Setaria viridis]
MNISRAEEFLRSRQRRSRKHSSPPTRSPSPTLGEPREFSYPTLPAVLISRRRLSPARPAGSGSRKQAPFSPTYPTGPFPGPTKQLPHSATPLPGSKDSTAPRPPSWLILDRFVHRSRRYGVVDCDATASYPAEDCIGRRISASLRIAGSPAVSRLYLHWPSRPWIQGMKEPAVIAAHGHSILFKVYVPFCDPHCHRPCFFPIDYFVYSAPCSPFSPPRLRRLPVCKDGVHTEPDDRFFQPYRRQQQRVMLDRGMGLLCHGEDGEFTVADLTHCYYHEVELCVLHDPPLGRRAEIGWSVERLQIPPDMHMRGLDLFSFNSDAVIPIHGCFLAWVDYYQGMLLVDVLHADVDPQLNFIPLPAETLLSCRVNYDEGCPDPARCVSVTDSGTIKLVCIITGTSPSFTIATWTLVDMDQGVWEKNGTAMEDIQFWGLYAGLNLPWVHPSFPVVSLVDPDVICFLLKEEDSHNFWMIEVNMRTEVLQSSAIYINEEEEERYSSKKTPRNFFDGHCFIPSKFSAYLEKDAITSQELSDVMQKKVIQRRAMQKSGVILLN